MKAVYIVDDVKIAKILVDPMRRAVLYPEKKITACLLMRDCHDEEQEPRKEVAQDYYAGYQWGNEPYESYDLPGRKTDSKVKSSILERLPVNRGGIALDSIDISVDNGIVILTGNVKTYKERQLVGQEVWRTCGVIKVLNDTGHFT